MQWHLESNLNYQRTMDIEWLAKMSPYTCCQHQSTTGLASCREEPCPHLHFGVLWGYIIWAGRLGVLPARSNSLKLQWSAMKILGFRKSSSGVFIFIYFFCLFPSKGEGLSTSFMTIAIFGSYSSPPYVDTILPTTPQGGYYRSCFKDQKLHLDKESFLRSGNWKVL